jgi:hypothetical protein
MPETALYLPVKRHLEAQGYTVKSEIKSCDVVAVRGNEPPVIVELKTGMTIQLLFQAVDRLTVTDSVYVAIERPKRGVTSQALKLCRRIGIGLIVVAASGSLEVLADPVPYAPRQNKKRKNLLLREFAKRQGDPNIGGSTRKPLMTAYRQDALRCVQHLSCNGASKISVVKAATGVDRASTILRDNVYGWFEKIGRGIYGLTSAGAKAPTEFKL